MAEKLITTKSVCPVCAGVGTGCLACKGLGYNPSLLVVDMSEIWDEIEAIKTTVDLIWAKYGPT